MLNKRILTLTFVVVAIALLFSGCCPEVCPTIPDCVCPECPDCVCPDCPDCVCPDCPDCDCPDCDCPDCPDCPDCVCPEEGLPEIVLFETDPDTIYKDEISHLDWLVTGADVVLIDKDIGYVEAAGSWEIKSTDMPLGVTTYTLKATNSAGTNTATTTITVNPAPNHAPIITSFPILNAIYGKEYTYDVEADDPDGDVLIYSLTVSPEGIEDMTIESDTGVIKWKPNLSQLGNNEVIVEVSDGKESTIQSFVIFVTLS